MLHAILLGIFKYTRDCFFEQIGPESKFADDINAVSKLYGLLFTRQSVRNLPKTAFPNGIRKGKLMAKEYAGILLCMAAVLRSTYGRRSLVRRRPTSFSKELVQDWIVLVETLLQWEIWLKSDKMELKHIKRAENKHRYIMYLMQKIGQRTTGMGLKVSKFHAISHIAQDILNFGVPMEVDTGSNESGRKQTKTAARLTQRSEATFDLQTATRLEEIHLLDVAEQEILGNCVWNYFEKPRDFVQVPEILPNPTLGGGKYAVKYVRDTKEYLYISVTKGKQDIAKKLKWIM